MCKHVFAASWPNHGSTKVARRTAANVQANEQGAHCPDLSVLSYEGYAQQESQSWVMNIKTDWTKGERGTAKAWAGAKHSTSAYVYQLRDNSAAEVGQSQIQP